MTEQTYPLQWPPGRKRVVHRDAGFVTTQKTQNVIQNEMIREIWQMGGTGIVISTNIPIRKDGFPYANAGEPADPAVAVYFERKKVRICFACDRYERVWMNMRAITKTIGAMRGIERWGSKEMIDQAFTGFAALPPPSVIEMSNGTTQTWQKILGISQAESWNEVRTAYRDKMRDAVSDSEKLVLNQAYDQAKKEFDQ